MLGEDRPGDAVAARVGELEADEQVVVVAPGVAVGGAAGVDEPVEARGVGVVDDELAGVGPAFGDDGGGLAPDQLGPAGPEPLVAAEGQLAGAPSGVPSQPSIGWIARRLPTVRPPTSIGRRQGREVVLQADVEARGAGRRAARASAVLYLK